MISQVFPQAIKVPRGKKKHLSSLLRSRNKGVQRKVEKSRKTMRESGQSSLSLERKNGYPHKTETSLGEEFLCQRKFVIALSFLSSNFLRLEIRLKIILTMVSRARALFSVLYQPGNKQHEQHIENFHS